MRNALDTLALMSDAHLVKLIPSRTYRNVTLPLGAAEWQRE